MGNSLAFDYSTLSVLLVEDSLYMRRITRMLLSGFGVRKIEEADDGAAALELFEQSLPDLVITDWIMPVFDGLELTRAIRNPESCSSPYTPIIMMTGYCERSRVTVARDAGVTEFLAKPISAKDLYLRINNCIVNPRQFVRTQTFLGLIDAVLRFPTTRANCCAKQMRRPLRSVRGRQLKKNALVDRPRSYKHRAWTTKCSYLCNILATLLG